MRISLIGYGKMGRAIETEALARGHQIVHRISRSNTQDWDRIHPEHTDIAIEFSHPDAFDSNLTRLLERGVPIVSGTTGWYARLPEVEAQVAAVSGRFLYGSNFSIGVNILFLLNQKLAQLMNSYPEYDAFIEERHHRNKADGPSGTAHSLAKQVLEGLDRKQKIATDSALSQRPPQPEELSIGYIRAGDIKGTHRVSYVSDIDTIEISHSAYNRRGFAIGAVIGAEWLAAKAAGTFHFGQIFQEKDKS